MLELEGGAAPARQHSRRTTPPGLGRQLQSHPAAAGAEPWSQQDQSSLSRCRPAPPGASGAGGDPTRLVGELDYLGGDPTILGWRT